MYMCTYVELGEKDVCNQVKSNSTEEKNKQTAKPTTKNCLRNCDCIWNKTSDYYFYAGELIIKINTKMYNLNNDVINDFYRESIRKNSNNKKNISSLLQNQSVITITMWWWCLDEWFLPMRKKNQKNEHNQNFTRSRKSEMSITDEII